ncbi:MAG: anthranilate phosphoribosyltransferase [Alphaproteobacteria bacterium]
MPNDTLPDPGSPQPAFPDILRKTIGGAGLSRLEARAAFDTIMDGEASDLQIAAFLAALSARGESVEEITAGAEAMRARARRVAVPEPLAAGMVDTCGTGGDGKGTLNISTAAAIVAAGAGVTVAKHGNRAASSKSGSSDVLEALGVNLDAEPEVTARAIAEARLGFLMAPRHHEAVRHVATVRKALGVRTIFNLLGPLSNPAGARRQVLGVFHARWLVPMADVLRNLGSDRVWVVHGDEGLDELSIAGPSHVAALKEGRIAEFTVTPEDAGLPCHPLEAVRGGAPEDNARAIMRLLDGEPGAYRDIVCLNAAACLVVGERAADLAAGAAQAAQAIESGAAKRALEGLVAISQGLPPSPDRRANP